MALTKTSSILYTYDISNVSLLTLQLTQPDLQPLDAARVPFGIKVKLNNKS